MLNKIITFIKNNKIAIIIISSLFLFLILLPFIIDWLIIGNNFPSNISNSDWVSFLAGYIGTILGGVISLIGIIWTIRFTREQNKLDRELQVRPYCSIRYVHDDKLVGTDKILAQLPIGCEPQSNNGPCYTSIIYIKNIGVGPAVEFDIKVDNIDDGRKHYPIIMQKNSHTSNHSVNLLQPGEEAVLPIYIYFNFDPITQDDIIDTGEEDFSRFIVKPEIMEKYKNFIIKIHIKYYDMFQNKYSQTVTLFSNMYIDNITENGATHLCDILLKEITHPIKSKMS